MEIRPISDMRNKFTEVAEIIDQKQEPIFLTKNGVGEYVLCSMRLWNEIDSYRVYLALKEAEIKDVLNPKRYTHAEVMERAKNAMKEE